MHSSKVPGLSGYFDIQEISNLSVLCHTEIPGLIWIF